MDDTTVLYEPTTHAYTRGSEYVDAVRSARLAVTDSGDHIPLSSFLAVQDLYTVVTDIFILSRHNSSDAQRNAASIKPPGQIGRSARAAPTWPIAVREPRDSARITAT